MGREQAHLDVVQEGIQLVVLPHEVVERPNLLWTVLILLDYMQFVECLDIEQTKVL